MEKLKILVVNNLYPPQVVGGYERAIADYAKLLQERGHQVLVITSNTEHLPTGYTKADSDPPTVRRCLSLWGTWTERGAQPFYPAHVAAIAVQNYKTLEELLPFFQPDVCLTGNADFLGSPILEQILAAGIPIAHYVMNSLLRVLCIDTLLLAIGFEKIYSNKAILQKRLRRFIQAEMLRHFTKPNFHRAIAFALSMPV
ncbi:MAG: hypothetical protein EAZ23_01450 [Oscillatoriales cyanobacterium]|nr:MAG: hypothetical protein EAZ23_01450 [Oscillatoriales cyanobacterium]